MAQKRGFGQMTKLPSKRYRARYTGPDTCLHNAPRTFETRMDAEAWLTDERRLIVAGSWTPPRDREARVRGPLTYGAYATTWLADRDLKPRTRQHYSSLLRSRNPRRRHPTPTSCPWYENTSRTP